MLGSINRMKLKKNTYFSFGIAIVNLTPLFSTSNY